ncbi:MAG: exodeoxyribonuclease III [Rickettsiales bacterium]|nr:exodeoxyribonuclease III [Rickettsiales bacterium]
MKIATWNVNSINSRKELFLKWLTKTKPEVVLLQETKSVDEAFPKSEIEEQGYNIVLHGQKTFNGVAILSKFPIDESIKTFPKNPVSNEARYLESVISVPQKAIRVISVYVPNGAGIDDTRYKIKLKFLEELRIHMSKLLKLDEIILIGGDFNVAPEEIDTYNVEASKDSVLFHIEVRKRFRAFLNLGYYDSFRIMHPNKVEFSWWDYRGASWYHNRGLRIDHILLSPEACDLLKNTKIDRDLRASVKPSDHAPVICELKI